MGIRKKTEDMGEDQNIRRTKKMGGRRQAKIRRTNPAIMRRFRRVREMKRRR